MSKVRLVKEKRAQFITIAALMIAIMMISISAILYGTVTYFRHERWQEYLIMIDGIETGTQRVVEISLANYTQTLSNNTILKNNLDKWRSDIKKAYAGFGVILSYNLENGLRYAYGLNINYNLGLAYKWYEKTSFSAANATVNLNVTSIGLTGYRFIASALLREWIRNAKYSYDKKTQKYTLTIYLSIDKEGLITVTNLQKSNFSLKVNGLPTDFTLGRYYSTTYNSFIYEIRADNLSSQPLSLSVTVNDTRNIMVVASSTEITPS